MDPRKIENRDDTANAVIYKEEQNPLSPHEKLKQAIKGAHYLVDGHNSSIVPKVEKLIKEFGTYERFPRTVIQKIADDFGTGEPVIVEGVYLVLTGEDKEIQ